MKMVLTYLPRHIGHLTPLDPYTDPWALPRSDFSRRPLTWIGWWQIQDVPTARRDRRYHRRAHPTDHHHPLGEALIIA